MNHRLLLTISILAGALAIVPTALACPLHSGAYKSSSSKAVFQITQSCTKRAFADSTAFFQHYTSWGAVQHASTSILDAIPDDPQFLITATAQQNPSAATSAVTSTAAANSNTTTVQLAVPFIREIPDGVWILPWSGACEEASIEMVDSFYVGHDAGYVPKTEEKNLMWPLFGIENKLFGFNLNTAATTTAALINGYSSFTARVVRNPTLEQIKAELLAGHPVITMQYGRGLDNPLEAYRRGASSYHVLVLTGFDDTKQLFYANDSDLSKGLNYPYSYDKILNNLHDYNYSDRQADGPPTVLFTQPKLLARAAGHSRIFLVQNNSKYYISNPAVFETHRLSMALVKEVSWSWLSSLPWAGSINS